jgi:hypothetical protein
MTIIRSLGVSALVALMSAHRLAAERCEAVDNSFDQQTVEAIEAYLRGETDRPDRCRDRFTERPRSYS